MQEKLAKLQEMEAKVTQPELQLNNNQNAANILNDMVSQGKAIVDEHGVVSLASEQHQSELSQHDAM